MIPPAALTALAALVPGPGSTRLVGTVVLGEAGPELQIASRRLPLPEGAPNTPGQRLPVLLSRGPDGRATLQLLPATQGTEAIPLANSSAPAASPSAQLAQVILQELAPGTELSPSQLGAMLPQALAANADPAKRLLRRLLEESKLGEAREGLLSLLGAAEEEGLPAERVAGYRAQLSRGSGLDADSVAQAAEAAIDAVEARLARGEDPFEAPLAGLQAIAEDEALRQWAAGAGLESQLDAQLSALNAAYSGAQLVNSRSLESDYRFFELSPEQAAGARVQVHLLSEEGQPLSLSGCTIVLDVNTEALGALWMRVHTAPNKAELLVEAERPSTEARLKEEAPALRDVLTGLGFHSAAVRVQGWDGDRVQATAELFSRYGGFEAEL